MSRNRRFNTSVLIAALACTGFASCENATAKSKETILHDFSPFGLAGAFPYAGLTRDDDGNLYGATSAGGHHLQGAIYKIAPDGTYTLLYSFAGGSDGSTPLSAPIVDAQGNLYGVTDYGGGDCNCGIVYKLSPKGKETLLHAFTGPPDGDDPLSSPVTDDQGNLYGTTVFGGASSNGAVYKVAPDGTETILYAFAGGNDGETPFPGVTVSTDGNIYGATSYGGTGRYGTVFRLTPAGTKTILYNFAGSNDVASPGSAPILDDHGNIYGLGLFGGGSCNCGEVYEIKANGREKILHSFTGGSDGINPAYGLARDEAGNLYGATTEGGSKHCNQLGCGAIFKIAPDGKESIVYAFRGGADGSKPDASPIVDALGNLYGTAYGGGANGTGVAFRLTP